MYLVISNSYELITLRSIFLFLAFLRRDFLKSTSKVKINYEENQTNTPNLLVNFFNVKKKFKVFGQE